MEQSNNYRLRFLKHLNYGYFIENIVLRFSDDDGKRFSDIADDGQRIQRQNAEYRGILYYLLHCRDGISPDCRAIVQTDTQYEMLHRVCIRRCRCGDKARFRAEMEQNRNNARILQGLLLRNEKRMFGKHPRIGNPSGIHAQYFDSADSVCLRRTVRKSCDNRIIHGIILLSVCGSDCMLAAGGMSNHHNDVHAEKNSLSRMACGVLSQIIG